VLADADLRYVALAVLWVCATLVIRALRWRLLLATSRTTFRHRLGATAVGFMGNSVLPWRLGEPLRCWMLATLEPAVGFTVALGTIVAERELDLAASLVCLTVFLAIAPTFAAVGRPAEILHALRVVGGIVAGGLGAVLLVSFALGSDVARTRGVVGVLLGVLPEAARRRTAAIVASFAEGLAIARSPRALAAASAWTAVLWLTTPLTDLCMLWALGMTDLGFVHALGLMVVLSFAVALPQAPGYLGVFQVASEATLVGLYGVPAGRAQALAIGLWAALVAPNVVAGVVAIWVEGLRLGDVRRAGKTLATTS
jgi:uncharacterized protein (TIRG00374 family)